jgi:hypothetical protein
MNIDTTVRPRTSYKVRIRESDGKVILSADDGTVRVLNADHGLTGLLDALLELREVD